ncbi:MAG TPA: STAS/SEC14 domain-containing protein [candidate division Zixibacteria bacterium]|nr:STAS/SEC14 domain-containing protein [candidate division Zixibacteria bacterium]
MPHTITWEPEGVRWTYSGCVTDQEAIQSNLDIYDDERFESIRYQLVDMLQVETFDVSGATIREISHMDREQRPRNPNIKVAFVTTKQVIYGMGRMYEMAGGMEAWETKVFETLGEAREWLGAPVPTSG